MISAMENSPRAFPHAPKCKDMHKRAITVNTEKFNVKTRKGKPTGEIFHFNMKELQA